MDQTTNQMLRRHNHSRMAALAMRLFVSSLDGAARGALDPHVIEATFLSRLAVMDEANGWYGAITGTSAVDRIDGQRTWRNEGQQLLQELNRARRK